MQSPPHETARRDHPLLTRVLLGLLRLLLRVFFRRVEVVGDVQLPSRGGIVYAPNHPNGLIDPLFLLLFSPRPVSFLAKESLFRMPVVGRIVKALRCLPVYRATDGHDTSANTRTLAAARSVLESGGAIGIFPEGVSHSDPMLQPLKTGAARIAMGAANDGEAPVHVVPCALHYSDKTAFRSHAALVYGRPIEVPHTNLGADGEPPRECVRELTERIKDGLAEVVLQAETQDVLELVAAATRLFEGVRLTRGESALPALDGTDRAGHVERSWRLQRRMLERYTELQAIAPERVHSLRERLCALERSFQIHGADLRQPLSARPKGARASIGLRVGLPLLISPLASAAIVLQYPAYRAVGAISLRAAGGEPEVVATAKLLAGMLAFPALWVLIAVGVSWQWGPIAALSVFALMPALGVLALWWSERIDAILGRARFHGAVARADARFRRLLDERDALYEALLAFDEVKQSERQALEGTRT